ncbi:MAG: hypothetical protein ACP5HS_05960 [Anaerolineae bacterium]
MTIPTAKSRPPPPHSQGTEEAEAWPLSTSTVGVGALIPPDDAPGDAAGSSVEADSSEGIGVRVDVAVKVADGVTVALDAVGEGVTVSVTSMPAVVVTEAVGETSGARSVGVSVAEGVGVADGSGAGWVAGGSVGSDGRGVSVTGPGVGVLVGTV